MSLAGATPTPRVALTIAGTDSGGGAGIAADLSTFAALGLHGTCVVTAVTAQNTEKVTDSSSLSPQLVAAQLDAVLDDFHIDAAKTGMLATSEIVDLVTARVASGAFAPLVVDPVIVATSGADLLESGALEALRRLAAHATVVTPNLPEASALLATEIDDIAGMRRAARAFVALGARAAVVKGGHLRGSNAVDIVFDGRELVELTAARVATSNTHGTGCTLSAAICAELALGTDLIEAIRRAKSFVHRALVSSASWRIGAGPGPIDHRFSSDSRSS